MNKLLLLFIILLLGLILCSFLGGNCYTEGFTTEVSNITGVKGNKGTAPVTSSDDISVDNSSPTAPPTSPPTATPTTPYDNYNHYDQTSYPTKYYGPNGTTATVINTNGTFTLAVTETNGTTTIYNVDKSTSSTDTSSISKTTFYGQNGGTAKVTTDNNGNYLIKVTQPDGTVIVYTVTNTQSTIFPPPQQPTTQSSTYSSEQNYSYYNSPNSNSMYNSTLPPGIPKSMIPPGQEDLYILKSQVVPPVCPACPACGTNLPHPPVDPNSLPPPSMASSLSNYFSSTPNSSTSSAEKCPPCPACARCPEPAFECKKVPNYNSAGSSKYLPMPVVSDFSSFGM